MKPFVVANWKANKNMDILKDINYNSDLFEVAIACPNLLIDDVRSKTKPYIKLCSQDCSKFNVGAYTGETPAKFLKEKGVEYVIIGHSERRNYFHEDSEILTMKAQNAFNAGLKVIYCIGEYRVDREHNRHLNVLYNQFFSVVAKDISITIAYEPIWAIGTGAVLEPKDMEEVIKNIRKWAKSINVNVRVLFGGSVDKHTIRRFRRIKGLDGYLVGGNSLNPEFTEIIRRFESVLKNISVGDSTTTVNF
ncbi:Triosephosphate isomerase [Nosema granulosis]|uniref:Triosephosphate isomerase n=1 Tax=Nosema granulosis TaxID=83296 RepID=A0A9P6KYM9_9MICR|nr:Triosephosphate isomerase [Nosema granulosis]